MKKVGIISLGCSKNRVDSENILGLLDHVNYQITPSIEESDIIIINTCGFITDAKRESINTILDCLSYNKPLVVCGCLVERYKDELAKEIPEVSLWIPIRDYYRFNELMMSIDDELNDKSGLDNEYRIISTGKHTAYLKIGEGCSNHCSYCAIPLIRGEYRSRDKDDILKEAKKLVKIGIKEIVLLEQDTSKYGIDLDDNTSLVTLLKDLLKIEGLKYIRLLYLYPDEIDDELINLMAKEKRILPYFDIPIQHSEDHILKAMNRRGNKNDLVNLFTKIRNTVPNSIIRTTVMVGFPGEKEEDVDSLIEFITKYPFDHLGAFTYSPEEGTSSASFPNQIDEITKAKRLDKVMNTQKTISYRLNKSRVGKEIEGIIIGKENDYYLLSSYFNALDDVDGKIFVKSDSELNVGDIIKVKITDAYVYDLFAVKIN